MVAEWDKNSAGNVWLTPLLDFQVAHLHGIGVGLRLELRRDPAESRTDPIVAQIGMTVEQADSLIEFLQLQVDAIRFSRPQSPAN